MAFGTDLNIQGIRVKYRTNGNCNISATESRLWWTKWYHLFSDQVRMLRRGAFGIFYTTISIEHSRTASPVAVLQRATLQWYQIYPRITKHPPPPPPPPPWQDILPDLTHLPPSTAYTCRWIGSEFVQIMACCPFGTKPLSKQMLGYCQPLGTDSSEILNKIFHKNASENIVCQMAAVLSRRENAFQPQSKFHDSPAMFEISAGKAGI